MMEYSSNCSCGNVSLALSLPEPIQSYTPRECDCDFCQARQLAYLSDKNGSLILHINGTLNAYRQGSEQAEFLACPQCDDVVAVTNNSDNGLKGAVSAGLYRDNYALGEFVPASPKQLSADEKRGRWSELWLSVSIDNPAGA